MIPIGPAMQLGFGAFLGLAGNEYESDCALIEFGLRSYCAAAVPARIGKTPVAWLGRPLPAILSFEPETEIFSTDFQCTEPWTCTLAVESQVVPWIQGPFTCAPPPPVCGPQE